MSALKSPIAICTYRVIPGKEEDFLGLLRRHWPTLHQLGLTTDEPAQVFRGQDEDNKTYFVEILNWLDPEAPNTAHQLPEVMAIWEPMGKLVESRQGRPAMEFPHLERIVLGPA